MKYEATLEAPLNEASPVESALARA